MERLGGVAPSFRSVVFLFGCACAGCTSPVHFRANIQSENPDDRILAVFAAGEASDRESVPLLVDRLEDEDEAVRFFAIQALEKIVGQRFGYDYAKPPEERAAAVERWRAYVRDGAHLSTSAGANQAHRDSGGATGTTTVLNQP